MTITDLGERALIARLRARITPPPSWVLTGVGDDAAVIAPARNGVDVITTDGIVEDVHFTRAWSPPDAIGHKALAVNLSDLAAMGATPRALLLSLALPEAFPLDDFDRMLDGFLALAERSRAPLVGGNLTRSPGPLMIDVTAIGSTTPRRVLRRSGARPGDRLFVTGTLGAGAAGLAVLQADAAVADDAWRAACLERYRRPTPRLRTGIIVGRNRAASACMDLSDGLADAVTQVAEASGCGIEIHADAVPIDPGAREWSKQSSQSVEALALAGGDDYELLFAVPRRRVRVFLAAVRQAGETQVTEIGSCVKTDGVCLVDGQARRPLPEGFGHF